MSERDPDDDEPGFDPGSESASVRQRRRTRRARRSLRVPVDEVPRRRSTEIEAVTPPVVQAAALPPPPAPLQDVDVPIELTPTGVALPPPAPPPARPLPDDYDELASGPTVVQDAPRE